MLKLLETNLYVGREGKKVLNKIWFIATLTVQCIMKIHCVRGARAHLYLAFVQRFMF